MRATGTGRAVRADRRERHVPEPDGGPAPARVSRPRGRAGRSPTSRRSSTCRGGCRARRCSPSSAARSATSIRRAAIRLLARVRAAMGPGDRFLMGVDLRKDIARIEAAYNDSQGITAEFNRNMLLVLNHELGADFDPSAVRAPRVLRPRRAPDRDAPRLHARPAGRAFPGSAPVRFAAGRVDPHRDQHQVRPRERRGAVRGRGSPDRGLAAPTRPRRSAWWSERPHEHAHPRRARRRSRERIFAAPGERVAHAAADRGRGRVHPGGARPAGGAVRSRRGPGARRCRSSAGYGARAGVGRDADRQGHAVLRAARRRHAHLRARRPARVQLARRAARRARCWRLLAVGRPAAPRGGGERGDHAAGRGHRSRPIIGAARRCCSRPSATSGWRTTWPARAGRRAG